MRKKLLILGAGGHGKVVREVAVSMLNADGNHMYETVDFLDDVANIAVGKIADLENFKNHYDSVFCGIGNNEIRKQLLEMAEKMGFTIPFLIHPSAYVSPTAKIEAGTVIEPNAIVNTNAVIRRGCIVSAGAIVDHDAVVGAFSHVNIGAIVKASARVDSGRKLEAGEVVLGYSLKQPKFGLD